MVTMNSVTITKFFHIIYKTLLLFLLAASKVKKELLELISNNFTIIETNRPKMLHLY